jgi:hypothetical protein
VEAEPEFVNAVRRAQALLHGLDVINDRSNQEQVLSGLRHEVDTLAVLLGLPLQVARADAVELLPPEHFTIVPLDFGTVSGI